MGKIYGAFGIPNGFAGAKDLVGNYKCSWLGHANVFAGKDDHSAGNV